MARLAAALAVLLMLGVAGPAHAQSAPSDFTWATRYDDDRRVTGTIAPDPDGAGPLHYAAVRNTYDPAGRLIAVETGELAAWQSEAVAPRDWPTAAASPATGFTIFKRVDTTYDALDRKLTEQVSGGGTATLTQYRYDLFGRLQCVAVRMNPADYASPQPSACVLDTPGDHGPDRITRTDYDAAGQVVQVFKAGGTSLQQAYATYGYNLNGKRTAVIDAGGNKATLGYDGHDRQVAWNFPSPTTPGQVSTTDYEAYEYDANGNRTSLRKRDGRTLTYSYDALNRVTVKTVPDGGGLPASATRDVHYGYDLRGLQTFARFDSATGEGVTNAYDGFGRLMNTTVTLGGTSRTLLSKYLADGTRRRLAHPDGQLFDYARDGWSRLTTVSASGATALVAQDWDAQGRVGDVQRWVAGSGWGAATTYGYDGLGRLGSLADVPTGQPLTTTLAYNPGSQIVGRTRDNDAYAWTGYVDVNRAYAANGLNQYASVTPSGSPAIPYRYDANGNLTADGDPAASNTNLYTYDVENRLVMATTAGTTTTLTYDPLGRLWDVTKGTATTRFVYDGDQLTLEYDAAGNILRRYVHGDGEDDPLVWYEGSGAASPRYLYADHQGSVIAIAESGTATAINAYDEYGMPKSSIVGTTVTNLNTGRFQYTGQAWLPELGLYHYKARAYSPRLGRFLQTDPIGYDDQVNLYAYVANDPVNKTDPSGNSITEIGFLIYDGIQLVNHVANGASAGEIISDVINVGLDVAPIPGLREIKGATEVVRAAEHGVQAARAERAAARGLPKPASGFGRVPRSERDAQRTFSSSNRAAKREAQGGVCANGCGTKIDASNSRGHHIERHADGGPTNSDNHAEVCIDCHKELHKPE